MTQPPGEAYDRGRLDGEVASALARHDDHFRRLNGSLEVIAAQMIDYGARLHVQTLAIQRLADVGDAREETVGKTAAALKLADEQRRRPLGTVVTVTAALVGVLGLAITLYVALRT